MDRLRLGLTLCALLWCLAPATTQAQEFRVYTLMYDDRPAVSPANGGERKNSEPVGRSLSLFHAGRVYDYLPAHDEFTVFEPQQQRYLIVNRARMLATQVSFEEIKTQLHRAKHEGENYLTRIPNGDETELARKLEATRFQIDPKFQEAFDPSRLRLQLNGEPLQYEVACCRSELPDAPATFLNYADWTAKLNYLMHPQTLYPAPRLALNASLRSRDLLPLEVRLTSQIGSGAKLRAVHQYQWKLDSTERRMISDCEALLKNPDLRQVTLQEFHQRLTSDLKSARRR